MAAGLEVASRSKDDFVRAATSEIGSWLDRIDVQGELAKVLSKMVLEVKAEIRFRPREDGSLAAEATTETKVKTPPKGVSGLHSFGAPLGRPAVIPMPYFSSL